MKSLKDLTLKEYTDLKRSGLMWIIFPDAIGDFRDDCEEINIVKVKDDEWKEKYIKLYEWVVARDLIKEFQKGK